MSKHDTNGNKYTPTEIEGLATKLANHYAQQSDVTEHLASYIMLAWEHNQELMTDDIKLTRDLM